MTGRQACSFGIFLYGLVCFLSAAYVGTGCSRGILREGHGVEKTWTCDDAADEALKQNNYETGIYLHEQLLEKEPENALALYHLGYAYGREGDHLKEASYYEKAIALGFRKDRIYYNLGMAYGELNDIEKSISAFRNALEVEPDNADNHFGLAMAYYQRGFSDTLAKEEFLNTIKIDPAHMDARLYLSILYVDNGEIQKAAAQLRTILQIDPNNGRAHILLQRIERE